MCIKRKCHGHATIELCVDKRILILAICMHNLAFCKRNPAFSGILLHAYIDALRQTRPNIDAIAAYIQRVHEVFCLNHEEIMLDCSFFTSVCAALCCFSLSFWMAGDTTNYIVGVVQERYNSFAKALDVRLFCTNTSTCLMNSVFGCIHSSQNISMRYSPGSSHVSSLGSVCYIISFCRFHVFRVFILFQVSSPELGQ